MAWSPLQELVTVYQAKQHLKLPLDSTEDDDDIQLKVEIATEMCLDYLTQRVSDADEWEATVDAWDQDTVPKRVIGAILDQFSELYRFRGDDLNRPVREPGTISPGAKMLLDRLRDPALA